MVVYRFSVVSKSGYQFSVVESRFLGLYRLNAGRMNQRYEGSLWAFPGASTPQITDYAACADFRINGKIRVYEIS